MKLKQLEQVSICGYKFKMIWNKAHSGGSFHIGDRKIEIGVSQLKANPEIVFMILLHELSEIIHMIINTRYDDPSVDGNYKFFLDHKEFENHNYILSETILKFIN